MKSMCFEMLKYYCELKVLYPSVISVKVLSRIDV